MFRRKKFAHKLENRSRSHRASLQLRAAKDAAFTLAEVMFPVGVLPSGSAAVIALLLQVKTHAAVARLKTLASIAATTHRPASRLILCVE